MIPKAKASRAVLLPADLPHVFSVFYQGPVLMADVSRPRTDPTRFGRTGSWLVRYHRPGSATTKGPLVIASRVDLFKDSGGAKKDLELYRKQLGALAGSGSSIKPVRGVGAEALALVQNRSTSGPSVVTYTIVWREANATAELDANGFAPGLTFSQTVALARAQQRHLRSLAR